jgi:hypothetical protein
MIYLHELLDVQPGMIDEYVDAAANHLIAGWSRYVKTVGFFKNAFRHREALALWELGEEAVCVDSLGGFTFKDLDGMAWQRLALKYRQDWYDSWIESVLFSPTVEIIKERQKKGDFTGNALYYWEQTRVLPGKMDEFLDSMAKEVVPMEEKRGMKLAGCYRWYGACGRLNEVTSLWAVKDLDHWGKIREKRRKDPAFQKWVEKSVAWRTESSYKFWVPVYWSLLH